MANDPLFANKLIYETYFSVLANELNKAFYLNFIHKLEKKFQGFELNYNQ